jgi:hypothetical protein
MCLGFTSPLPRRPKQYLEPEGTVGHIWGGGEAIHKHIIEKWKKSLNIVLHFLDFAHIQIHNHACSLVGISFLENWVQAQVAQYVFYTTAENWQQWPCVKCCVLHKITVRYINISTRCRISWLFTIWNEVSFYSIQERYDQDNLEKKSGWLETLRGLNVIL